MALVSDRIDSYLSTTSSPSLHFLTSQEHIDLDTDVSIELKRLNSHFSKLKLGYLHLMTQRSLLENLISSNDNDITTTIHRQRVQEMDTIIQKGKKEMKELQQQLNTIKGQIQKTVIDVVHQWETYQSSRTSFVSSYDATSTKQFQPDTQTLLHLNTTSSIYGNTPSDIAATLFHMNTIDTCTSITNYQLKYIEDINTQIIDVEGRIQGMMQKEIPEWEHKMEGVKKLIGEMTESASSLASATSFVTLNTQTRWYTATIQTLITMNGISIVSCVDTVLTIAILLPENQQQHVQIKYDSEMNKFIIVTLISSDIYITDIVDYAIQQQSLSFLCRELYQRLISFPNRLLELNRLSTNYIVAISTTTPTVTITLQNYRIIVTLDLGWDYPSTYSYVQIQSMEALTTWDPMSLEFIQASVNHLQLTNLADIIQHIETAAQQHKIK